MKKVKKTTEKIEKAIEDKKKKKTKAPVIVIKAGVADAMLNSPVMLVVKKKDFSLKFSYWLSRIVRKIADEMREFQEKKRELLKEYARKDEKGEPIVTNGQMFVDQQFVEKFNEKYNELADIDINVGFECLELDLDKGPKLTSEEVDWLMPLLKEVDGAI